MVDVKLNLTGVPEAARGGVENYVRLLTEAAGDKVESLTLYGRVTSEDFDKARDVIRNVVVVDSVDLSALRALSKHGLALGKAGIAAPLVMTPDYIQSSLDTFPIELLDIQLRHIVVFGSDYFEKLTFEESNMRLQCERELKAILIGLRQGLLAAAGREKILGALERDAAEGLLRTMRSMLWLKGKRDVLQANQVIVEVERLVDRRLTGIRSAVDHAAQHGWDQFEALYMDVESLGKDVDGWS